jgi:hypothetical protein
LIAVKLHYVIVVVKFAVFTNHFGFLHPILDKSQSQAFNLFFNKFAIA